MAFEEGEALQIIKIEDNSDEKFTLNEELLSKVLNDVEEDMPIAVLSILGAFRTGKSFFLDFLLRYLRNNSEADLDEDWMLIGGGLEGNYNSPKILTADDESIPPLPPPTLSHSNSGFGWRSGSERTTTGIWLWSKPFVFTRSGKKIALLIIDTQGMFDNETGQMLTASIFGLSTLISSYQIYNVEKRIQEDNLQHLSLFTEYGRIALVGNEKDNKKKDEGVDDKAKEENVNHPFQRLDFLVRDWQNFSDETSTETCLGEMAEYLDSVLKTRAQKDLAETRLHISSCFKEIGCFLLPHPGIQVTKRNYDGDVSLISAPFKTFINIYLRSLLTEKIDKKVIRGKQVFANELFNYIKAYVQIFKDATIFPEARTLLAATAMANNHNAKDNAFKAYKVGMDSKVGIKGTYISQKEIEELHSLEKKRALIVFDDVANVGSEIEIGNYKKKLIADIEEKFLEYCELNKQRDPFRALEYYIIPLGIAAVAYILRIISDLTCSEWSDVCATSSDFLSHIYLGIFFFILLVVVTTSHGALGRIKAMTSMISKKD